MTTNSRGTHPTPTTRVAPNPPRRNAPLTGGRAYLPVRAGDAPNPTRTGGSPRRPDDATGMATRTAPAGTPRPVETPAGAPKRREIKITPQQRKVLTLASSGMTNVQIAVVLNVKPTTVRTHMEAAYARLGVRRRAAALCRCYALGILTPPSH